MFMIIVKDRKPRVCLDAGHNGSGADTGATGSGLREQDLTLDIARRTRALLINTGRFDITMTRDGDFVTGPHSTVAQSLQTRCNIANQFGADLMVSIHINASPGGTGSEILIQGAGGRANDAAKDMLPFLIDACGWSNRGIKVQNVMVLRETTMPAILTENGFIDSPNDGARLGDPNFRQKIAIAHAKGICKIFNVAYSEKTQEAKQSYGILIHTQDDLETAKRLFGKYGQCAVFFRDTVNKKLFSQDVYSVKTLIIVGGASVSHPNEILLSGNSWFDTNVAVGKHLG